MSYRILSSNVVIGGANVPPYAFVTTPGGALQLERLDAQDAVMDIQGNLECDHVTLASLATPNRVLTTDPAGRLITTSFDADGLGNADALVSGTVPSGRLQGGSYSFANLTVAGSVTAGTLVGNVSAAAITSGQLPPGRLAGGTYTFTDLTLSNALTAATLVANISANNLTSGTLSDDRLSGAYTMDTLDVSGNVRAEWVHANLSATDLTTGILHDDRLQGHYTLDTVTISNVITANAVHIPSLLGSNVLISDGNGTIISSNVTSDEVAFLAGVTGPVQVQIDELFNGNIEGGNITNLDANNVAFGTLHDDRLSGDYSFAKLTLAESMTANTLAGALDAAYLTGTIPSERVAGSYTVANLIASAVSAAEVSANLTADDLVTGTVPPGRLAGGTYTIASLAVSGNVTSDWVHANLDASRIQMGTVDNARLDLENLVSNVTPGTSGLDLGAPGAAWRDVYANTVHVDDIYLANAIMYRGNAVVLDLEQTTQDIIPAGAGYTLGNATMPWHQVHADTVVAGGNIVLQGTIVNPDMTPFLDLSNVETDVVPFTGGLSVGTVDRPWEQVVANTATIESLTIGGNVTTDLLPATTDLDLGAPAQRWNSIYATELHANIDAADVYGELDANIVFTGGSIDGFVLKAPGGTVAQPGLRFVEDEQTGVYLAGPNTVGISCGNTSVLTVDANALVVSGNVVPGANALYDLGAPGAMWRDVHLSNALYAGPVSITDGAIAGVTDLTASGTVDADTITATALVSGSTLEGNLDAAYLTGIIDPARLVSGTYSIGNLTIAGNASIAGTTTVRPSGHVLPQANMQYDLGSSTHVWRDIYLAGSTIHLGNATIQESQGNVVISKLHIDGSIVADGLLAGMTILNVQVCDASWVPLDDTAVSADGGKVLITGTGFGPGCLCQIGGTNAASTSYVSSTQIRVDTGARPSGTTSLTVIRGDTQTATFPAGITFSQNVVWITDSQLGNVEGATAFTIPLVATSDSTISFANVTALPPQTTLDHVTGNLTGNITSVGTDTLFSFDVDAVDEELQNARRTFLLQLLVLLINGTGYTDASWTPLTQTALDSNVSTVYWTIDGQGMNQATGVLVDGTPATSFTRVDDSTLRVTGPQKPRGTYDVTVQTAGTSKVLANAVFFSDVPTWVTPTALGNVEEGVPFSFPLEAVSDSTISYANVDALPPSTALHPTSGVLAGTITGVAEDTQYNVGINATDAEYQLALRTFVLQYLAAMRVSKISSSWGHTLALSTTGRLVSWGANNYGQTGVGTAGGDVTLPVDITTRGTLAGRTITSISTGSMHSCALTSDGRVHCWGSNTNAECGQGNTTSPVLTPVIAGGAMTGRVITSIASGGQAYHVLALDDQGVVYAWGNNGAGECGQGNTVTPRSLPVAVTGGSLSGRTVQKITCGMNHSIALASDGTLHSWGSGFQGYLGTGNTTNQSLPQNITNNGSLSGKTITDVHARGAFTIVLCSDNSVHTFGGGSRLGDGTTNIRSLPVNITSNGSLGGKVITSISAGINIGHAIASDGSLHGWGIGGTDQQVGDGTQDTHLVPVNISSSGALGNQSITRLCEAGYHTFVIVDDGKGVVAWGRNTNYQVGDGTNTTPRPTPLDVTQNILPRFSLEILKIAAGYGHTLALSNQGRLVGWGQNISGKTGVGNTTTPVTLPVDITVRGSLAGHVITDIACGGEHSVAVTDNGVVHCWGDNTTGQCGQGNTTSPQLVPVVTGAALAGKTVIMVACGTRGSHTLALDDGGVVYAWGQNSSGECGQGHTTTPQTLPVAVTGGSLSGKVVTKISAGQGNSLALCSDGTVHSWGVGGNGENGNGSTSNQTLPINISFGSKTVVDIDASGRSCIALCSDFTVYTWGYNEWGECGTGNTTTRITSPTDITSNGSLSGKNIVGIYMSEVACHVLASDNSCHAWGYGGYASIGNGLLTPVNSLPLEITNVGALAGKTITRLSDAGLGQLVIVDGGKGVVAWGRNPNYEIGDGTNTQRPTPVDVTVNIMTKL